MKVAIVSQPTDEILPPFQNSIGYYSWSLALQLARSNNVTVFGREEINEEFVRSGNTQPELIKIPSSSKDRAVFKFRCKLGQIVQISSPISTSNLYFPEYGRRVAVELSRRKFDIIHVQHCSQYLPIIRKLNPWSKIVLHLHAEWFSQSNFEALRERLRHADFLFAVSDHIVRQTVEVFPEVRDRIRTIYCGINVEEFKREKDYASARARNERRILYCGAVSPHKGAHVLIEAFRIIAAEEPRARLEFVGLMGTYPLEENFDLADRESLKRIEPFYAKNRVERLKARLGLAKRDSGTYQGYLRKLITPDIAAKVIFSGFVPREQQLERYYESDIFSFPPVWDEGCGITPIEGMAAGMPVVGSRSGGLVETVRDGETGFLAEKHDADALARQLLRLLRDDDLREQMGRAARHRALKRFEWENIAAQAEAAYRALTGAGTYDRAPQAC